MCPTNLDKSKKEDATWCALIRKIATIDKQAAKKILTMRCPDAVQEQNATCI